MSAPRAQANFFGDLAAGDPDAAQPASRIVDSTLGPIPSVQHRTLGPMASVQHRISGTIPCVQHRIKQQLSGSMHSSPSNAEPAAQQPDPRPW
ncbi:hypothetical protein LWF15_05045 [Kineosporia rhizophila]|uniref:hypothetical protein n=1 Tax=Kineosporia rhizophila TaxID=84633 RepID=UPI001E57F737|nr:hypothetical protein [Kineosporia rhizophila]MCE0534867.1 hypothetical protein [Kineosporia rhizophila]